ncbi:MAG: hypothetical protein WCY28_02780 [Candidatus Shapirobacteria bacterium]|jgi:hypothetical protein
MEENKKTDHVGNIIVFVLLSFLIFAGYLSYKSIDWEVLKRLENEELILPTPIPTSITTQSAQITPTTVNSTTSTIKK